MTDGIADTSTLSGLISGKSSESHFQNNPPKIFSYSLGSNAETAKVKSIACDSGGFYEHIDDGGDLVSPVKIFSTNIMIRNFVILGIPNVNFL